MKLNKSVMSEKEKIPGRLRELWVIFGNQMEKERMFYVKEANAVIGVSDEGLIMVFSADKEEI